MILIHFTVVSCYAESSVEIHCSYLTMFNERVSKLVTLILHKFIYKFHTITIKIPAGFFEDIK